MESKPPLPSPIKSSDQASKPADILSHKPAVTFGKTYLFRLRQHKTGNFHGLWELAIMNAHGKVENMISDADALTFCLDNLMGELENDGF